MPPQSAPETFGDLLRTYRIRAGLSQERLAERAGISAKAIGAIEQGVRRAPYRHTVAHLSSALDLSADERTSLEERADDARRRALANDAPAAAPPAAVNNLPRALTPFVERDDVETIVALLTKHRLVTITGAGGVGKTRTAIEASSRRAAHTDDAVVFVDLSSLRDGAQVVATIAAVLNLQLAVTGDPALALAAALGSQHVTLVLDNCEQIVAPVALVARAILTNCQAVSLLATSRERLAMSSEVVYRLPSLKVSTAVALFVQRAQYADARYTLPDSDLAAIADICRRLDGMPLAIELAAARLPSLGLDALRTRLERAMTYGSSRDLPQRHQTMHATISWSFDLLDSSERSLLESVTIFDGGFTLEAAEAACSAGLPTANIASVLTQLVEKSLVNVAPFAHPPRYTLFESIRSFGRLRLQERNAYDALALQHARWLADVADATAAQPESQASDSVEIDNARAAIAWCLARGDQETVVLAARIIYGLRRIWTVLGRKLEQGHAIESILAQLVDSPKNYTLIARLWVLRLATIEHPTRALVEEATPYLERGNDPERVPLIYAHLAVSCVKAGAFAEADAAFAVTTAYYAAGEARKDGKFFAYCRNVGAWMCFNQRKFGEARALLLELLERAERKGASDEERAGIYRSLTEVEFAAGDTARAIDLSRKLLQNYSDAMVFHEIGTAMSNLCCYLVVDDNLVEAEHFGTLALERLATWQNDRPHWDAVIAMQHLAAVAALRGQAEHAATLLGFIDAYRASVIWVLPETDRRTYDLLVASVNDQLPEAERARLTAEGAHLDFAAAVELLELQLV